MLVVGLESKMRQAWHLLMNESAGRIAIRGRGGIGKTTLMRQLYNKLVDNHHFENLIWVTVSSNSTLEKIQDDISKCIGLFNTEWVQRSFVEKAQLIDNELSGKKFVLFLDDIWRKINLLKLGIPNFGGFTPNKLIFTTRSESVADQMFADSVLEMGRLSMKDSWQLFRIKVGDNILMDANISQLSEILVSRCDGLPILLCTVGRAMASRKTSEEWFDALAIIRRREGADTRVNCLLQFCFDSLPNDRIKCCLMYFSLFPEDFIILKNELIDFWVCEHLLDGYDTEDDTLDLGYSVVNTLVGASLLEEEEENYVKLLDMIRDFSSSVAMTSQMLKNTQLIEATLENVWTSRMGNSILKIENISDNLFTFLLNHNAFIISRGSEVAQSIPGEVSLRNNSFETLLTPREGTLVESHVLTVLDLSHSGIEDVPREISTLVSLQYLNLSHTWINRLPVELKQLAKLKCLNLEYDDQLRVIPSQLISSLSSLQVLKMFRCGYSVEALEDNILSVGNMNIDPLLCLEHLKVLSITITCASALCKFFSNPKFINCTQSLSLEIFWGSKSINISPLAAMNNLLTVEIHQAEVLEELNFNLVDSKFPSEPSFGKLRKITLGQCSNLRELTWVILAPNLIVLRVGNCGKIEEIISIAELGKLLKGGENFEAFAKLETLALESLPKVKSIYWKALPFKHLKKIEIIDCLLLRKLPFSSDSADPNKLVIESEEDWWKDIEWEDDSTKTTFLPCFRQSSAM
ncbi:disease resistance protein RPS5-like [Euphorbia lathyris]|uniref:disease resistance protein RPS5-like n=1 Tax=Euphorbia lathyris TaxID=212925 RepID=UPI00331422B7